MDALVEFVLLTVYALVVSTILVLLSRPGGSRANHLAEPLEEADASAYIRFMQF